MTTRATLQDERKSLKRLCARYSRLLADAVMHHDTAALAVLQDKLHARYDALAALDRAMARLEDRTVEAPGPLGQAQEV